MTLPETELVIDYFHTSSPEHLDLLGVDPTRLPGRSHWRELYAREYAKPLHDRASRLVLWLSNEDAIGFSTADKIRLGEEAYMHLHITDPARRGQGVGAACVRSTADFYFRELRLSRVFCEPNAFNQAPNRTLQRAGFAYAKTYNTVPGPLNYRQPVNPLGARAIRRIYAYRRSRHPKPPETLAS